MTVPRKRPPEDAAEFVGDVQFHDVDALRIVWHGHYYKYFEMARTVLFLRHGIDGPELLESGYKLVVSRTECAHIRSLTYRDRYRVRAWFLDIEQRINVGFEVWNLTEDARAARGRTELVTLGPDGVMLLATPSLIVDRINRTVGTS